MKIPRSVELLIGCGGIFFSFSYFAVLQEDVYKKKYGEEEERFSATLLAIGIERGINALIGLLGIGLFGGSGIKIPIMDIFNSGISQMLAMATSNEALRYVSFPTQVLGKSCKMVPTMAGGIIIGGKKYSFAEYVQVIMVTVGVCVFNFAGKSKKGGADSSYGLMLIGGSLLLDMVTSGMQDKVKAKTKVINPSQPKAKPTQYESMFYTNLSGCLIAFLLGVLKGDLATGVAFCLKYPEVMTAILVYSLASAVGQNFIYYTLTAFDPLVLSTVTTTRKIFSTVYSVVRDPSNSLNQMQWSGCGLVFLGLLIDVADKFFNQKAKPKEKADAPAPAPAEGGKSKRSKKAD